MTTRERTAPASQEVDSEVQAAIELRKEAEEGVRFVPFGATKELHLTPDEVRNIIATPTKSGKLPSDREIQTFLKLCEFRGLNPYVGDAFLVGYDTREGPRFSCIVGHQAMMKRADAHDKYAGKESGVIIWDNESNQKRYIEGDVVPKTLSIVGGWCRVYRSDRERVEFAETNMRAYNQDRGHWKVDPGWMICKCAQVKAFRAAFPQDLEGMEIHEEVEARMEMEKRISQPTMIPISEGRPGLQQFPPAPEPVFTAAVDDTQSEPTARETSGPSPEELAELEAQEHGELFPTHDNSGS